MECQHCAKQFSEQSEFDTHRLWHTERQQQLKRPPGRTYGARYKSNHATTSRKDPKIDSTTPKSPTSTSSPHLEGTWNLTDNISAKPSAEGPNSRVHVSNGDELSASTDSVGLRAEKLHGIFQRFPSYEGEGTNATFSSPGLKCQNCDAIFSSAKDYNQHYLSRYCPGGAAIAYLMILDKSQAAGYRIEKKLVPFNGQSAKIRCRKCDNTFSSEKEKERHEKAHPIEEVECLHCLEIFETAYELESHYDWHDDMEFRHHRDTCRAKSSGLLSSYGSPSMQRNEISGSTDLGTRPLPRLGDSIVPGTQKIRAPWAGNGLHSRSDGELVAISFISAEDLERLHAPDGVFREVADEYANGLPDGNRDRAASIASNLEGTTVVRDGSFERFSPKNSGVFNKGEAHTEAVEVSPPEKLKDPLQVSISNGPTLGRKPSRLGRIFRRSKSEDSKPPRPNKRMTMSGVSRSLSIRGNPLASKPPDEFQTIRETLQRVELSARMGDLRSVKRESDRLLQISSDRVPQKHHRSRHDTSALPGLFLQAHGQDGEIVITDVCGRIRLLVGETLAEVFTGIIDTSPISIARAKASVLSKRANMSSKRGDLQDAAWSYRKVIEVIRKFPMLTGDAIWEAVILYELARIYDQIGIPAEAELFYMEALDATYKQFGLENRNNLLFINSLGVIYESAGRAGDAAAMYKRSLLGRMNALGLEDPDTLMTMQELGTINITLGNLEPAKNLLKRALTAFEASSGPDSQMTLTVMNNLSTVYQQLQLQAEARTVALKMIPRCRAVLGPDNAVTCAAVTRFIQSTNNFDFSDDVKALLDHYRQKLTGDTLWVLQGLARAYLLNGLQRDAAKTFEHVFEARRSTQGADRSETLDALCGNCLALESLDDVNKAIHQYNTLLHISIRTPEGHPARERVESTRRRIEALRLRQQDIKGERVAWRLDAEGPCVNCKYITTALCPKCKMSRFCCAACRNLDRRNHDPRCHPSITVVESRSVSADPNVPQRILDQVPSKMKILGLPDKPYIVKNAFTFYLDRRNFTTFRVKFNFTVNTFLFFSKDADVRFALNQVSPFKWYTPTEQESACLPKGPEMELYFIVAPGEEMMRTIVQERKRLRAEDADFDELEVPNEELVEYSQGLLLKGREKKPFLYVVEWDS